MWNRHPLYQKSQFMSKFVYFAYIGPNTGSAKSQFFAKQTKIFYEIRNDQQAKLCWLGTLLSKKINSWASLYSSHILGQTRNLQNLNFLLNETFFYKKRNNQHEKLCKKSSLLPKNSIHELFCIVHI